MTTTRIHRCDHCKEVYPYHPSVYGMMPRYNDDQYCPSCAEVVQKALESIPVKFIRKFVPSTDYTREQLIEAQELRCTGQLKNAQESGGLFLPVKRIMPGLFDLKDNSVQQSVCERMPDPKTQKMFYYLVTWWPKRPDEVEISKEVWWDVENDCVAQNQEDYRR